MATLQGEKVQDTYGDLLQVSNSNNGIDTTLRQVADGKNTTSELYLQQSGDNRGIALGNGTNKPIIFGGITKASPYAMKYNGNTSTLGDAITGLTGGTTAGFLLASGPANAHVVITLSANDVNDGFHILGPTTPAVDAGLDASYFSVQPHEAVINDTQRDMDFRWESDTSAYGFFCEGSSGNVAIGTSDTAQRLTVNGSISCNTKVEAYYLSAAGIGIQSPGSQCSLEIGQNQTSNQYAYIDLVGDTTYTDYALRLIRGNTGANADSSLIHRGTGSLNISVNDAGSLKFKTSGTQRAVIKSDGKVGIGTDAPNHELTVIGTISASDGVFAGGNAALAGKYDTGWINGSEGSSPLSTQIAQSTNITLTHNFGTASYAVCLYAADDSSGTNSVRIDYNDHGDVRRGAIVYDVDTNSLKIRTWAQYRAFGSGGEGAYTDWTSKYVRIILIG